MKPNKFDVSLYILLSIALAVIVACVIAMVNTSIKPKCNSGMDYEVIDENTIRETYVEELRNCED